jgi:hypothetical protein
MRAHVDLAAALSLSKSNTSASADLPCKHAASASAAVVVPAKICTMRAGTVRNTAALILRSCRRAFGGHGFLQEWLSAGMTFCFLE